LTLARFIRGFQSVRRKKLPGTMRSVFPWSAFDNSVVAGIAFEHVQGLCQFTIVARQPHVEYQYEWNRRYPLVNV